MRSTMLGKVREYKWELWLFFGMPVVASTVGIVIAFAILSSDSAGLRYAVRSLSGYMVWLVMLGVTYWWVHRSGRELLRLVWQYSLAIVPFGVAYTLMLARVYGSRFERLGSEEGEIGALWLWLLWWVWFAMTLAVLVCFSRRASRSGFDKALVLIGVIALPGVNLLAPIDGARFGYEIGVLAVKVLLSLVAIWALHSTDAGKSVGRRGIVALFGSAMVAYASPYVALDIENSFLYETPILSTFYIWIFYVLPMVVAYGITILAAYMIRVRLPKQEPPPEEPVDSSTLLYGGGWRDSS